MGKAEIRQQLYVFLEKGTEYAFKEVKPLSVVGLGFLPGNRVTKMVLRPVILGNMNEIEMSVKNALTLAMDYSEELARGEKGNADKYRRKFLESDIFYTNYEGDRKGELREMLIRHFDEMAHDMAPLVETDADGFWDAVVEMYGKYETEELLRHHFSFIGKVVEEFGDEIEMTFSVSIFSFDYTDEALRILPKVETRIRRELVDKTDEIYGSRYGEASSSAGERVEMRDGSQRREAGTRASAEEFRKKTANQETASEERKELEKKVETLGERVRELEDEKEELRRSLKEARETNEELREKLEKKEEEAESESDSYNAEDWLG
jgi:hypothetical protein